MAFRIGSNAALRTVISATAVISSSRSMSTSPVARAQIDRICVFGAGLMGAGIVQVAAYNGLRVVMTDVSDEALNNGRNIISKSLSRVARKAHADDEAAQKALIDKTFANIEITTDPARAVEGTHLVVEAVIENMKVKQELFGRLDKLAPKDAIFASNTSSLSISEIASSTSAERQPLWVGVHFFNPVPQMKLVEVIRTRETADETHTSVLNLCSRLKKTTVTCKDTPGFIVNRLLVPYMLEAMRMIERGDATAEDVDTAMRLGAGYPMGPIELADFVGLNTLKHITDGWREQRVPTGEIGAEGLQPVEMLNQKVAEGKFGRKSAEGGFFTY